MSYDLDKPAAYHFEVNMEVAVSSKIVEPVNWITCCHIQEDHVNIHGCKNLKSQKIPFCFIINMLVGMTDCNRIEKNVHYFVPVGILG
jgi:hypothetical protein